MWTSKFPCCLRCHKVDQPHHGHGYCLDCYNRVRNPNLPEQVTRHSQWSKHGDCCLSCGTEDIIHHSKGLCNYCYNKAFREERKAARLLAQYLP